MPTYQYQCKKCGHTHEELQLISDAPLVRCPACHTDNLVRVMGTGAGVIFKGSGFYLTDYKRRAGKAGEKPKKPSPGDDKGSTTRDPSE